MAEAEEFFDDGASVAAVIAGQTYQTRGFLDRPTEEVFGGTVSATAWELRYATAALPGLTKNQVLSVDGKLFKTTEPPRRLFDGATAAVNLTEA